MVANVDDAIRTIFEIYFQRNSDPEFHENCPGCSREFSGEEQEKDIIYQEKLFEAFQTMLKKKFTEQEIIFIAGELAILLVSNFMAVALAFCNEDAVELRNSIFAEGDDENDERRIV